MKAKTKFAKMFYKLPEEARKKLAYMPYGKNPMALNACALEISHDTKLGKSILKGLGYKND